MKPHSKNACGGNFKDWMEVNLLQKCNAHCAWCVERDGWHPKEHADWKTIARQAVKSGNKNIILLGGEPTLYPYLKEVIEYLEAWNKNVWITTNGSMLNTEFIKQELRGITGINISLHSTYMFKNQDITGIMITGLEKSIKALHDIGASVRLNCNCIKGYVDSEEEIEHYVDFAKEVGADKIRFAELKQDDGKFVDLTKILNYKYGTNDDPFINGCNNDVVINGMPVNFRQMCGLQTGMRPLPENPEQETSKVLYYDGKMYDGWQIIKQGEPMDSKNLESLLQNVASGVVKPEVAHAMIDGAHKKEVRSAVNESGDGCVY